MAVLTLLCSTHWNTNVTTNLRKTFRFTGINGKGQDVKTGGVEQVRYGQGAGLLREVKFKCTHHKTLQDDHKC